MEETTHTPGPWRQRGKTVSIPYGGPSIMAEAFAGTEANARLIAAAPELAEQLREMTEQFCELYRLHFGEDPEPIAPVKAARAALSRAIGDQP